MVNLKLSPEDQNKMPEAMAYQKPQYPYGLQINLDNDTLMKLGIEELPEVGTEITFKAKALVHSTMENESMMSGENNCMCLQITDLEIPGAKKMSDAAKKLYGENE